MYTFDPIKLKKLQEKQGLNNDKLALLLGISCAAVGKWSRNNNKPNVNNLERMTEIFKCSPNSFFTKL